jgi:4-methylaminobutanoate oxidase (formaldehyde-forming)
MVGLFETTGASVEIPANDDFSFKTLPENWDRMMPYIEQAFTRIPEARNVGIKQLFCGPESFTPDNLPVVGPAPNLKNYYVAAGMNSIGILTGGGIGAVVAEWVDENSDKKKTVNATLSSPKSVDVTGIHVNRFDKHQSNPKYREERVVEALGNTYALPFPHRQPQTCRGIKRSPLHSILETTQNACFKLTSGWESPMYYGAVISKQQSFGRESWFPLWKAEHEACREAVCLFDMSFMSKILVQVRFKQCIFSSICKKRS